jgi:hypothetical protein
MAGLPAILGTEEKRCVSSKQVGVLGSYGDFKTNTIFLVEFFGLYSNDI